MTPIMRALALGYAAPQILEYVQRAIPSLGSKITRAKKSGYSVEEILNILHQGFSSSGYEGMTESQIHKSRSERQNQLGKDLLKLGIGSIGGIALSRGLPAFMESLKGSLGKGSSAGSGAVAEALQSGTQTNQPEILQQQQSLEPIKKIDQLSQTSVEPKSEIAQMAPEAVPTTSQQPPELDSPSILAELGVDQKINNLLAQGKSPQQVSREIVGEFNPKQKKLFSQKVQKGAIPPTFEALVQDYASKTPKQDKSITKPVKGDLVALPNGEIGELEHIKEKQALVKSEGRLHKVNASEIISSPIPAQDLASLHDELISGIEKETGEEVSRNVNWAGYDPATNRLAYLPHLGALYFYDDISPDERTQLTSLLNQRKTSGENFIGAWKEGSKSPIGAAMAALIKKLQAERGGKGQEYSGKFETIYDALEPAKKASKKKHLEMKKKRKK
jgi:hypothetical protein